MLDFLFSKKDKIKKLENQVESISLNFSTLQQQLWNMDTTSCVHSSANLIYKNYKLARKGIDPKVAEANKGKLIDNNGNPLPIPNETLDQFTLFMTNYLISNNALLLAIHDDAVTNWSNPARSKAIRFASVTDFHIDDNDININIASERFGSPDYILVNSGNQQIRVHNSRFYYVENKTKPLLEEIAEIIINATNAIKSLSKQINATNIGVYIMPPENDNAIINQSAAAKAANNLMQMQDGDAIALPQGANWNRLTVDLKGKSDAIDSTLEKLAAFFDMPISIYLGLQTSGISNNSDDLEKFYEHIDSTLRETILRALIEFYYFAKKLGAVPTFEFEPMWSMSAKEQAEINKLDADAASVEANTINTLSFNSLIDDQEAIKLTNKLIGEYYGD